jgi:hypothetical protein
MQAIEALEKREASLRAIFIYQPNREPVDANS